MCMENLPPVEGSGLSSGDASGESSGSTLQLNIKTLDSRIFNFHVDKSMLVTAFKEKIAQQIGVPAGQQRLIFRGKVLKDEHILSEYNVEDGDTLHLVERQPQPFSANTGEATSRNSTGAGGQDFTAGPRSRIGQIAHSVVLGTLNVGDPGEAVAPDLNQIIGAVLSSIGLGNPAGGMQPGVQTSRANETERPQVNPGSQNQGGNRFAPFQASHSQSAPGHMQRAGLVIPSVNMPIPDSLSTLVEFMNRMELALSQNGTQQSQSSTASNSPPIPEPELPLNSHGYPSVEALTNVLRHAQRLLSDHVAPALSRTAGRLDQEGGGSSDRGQVQIESVQLGVAMQHLGALFLELGRTILTLRIGQSSGESLVNAGPAVYISPSGPNPIMVQPFPLQTRSLFRGSSFAAPNNNAMGPMGSITRNVNIHIHTGAALAPFVVGNRAPNGEEMGGQQVNVASREAGQARVPPGVNATRTAVSSRAAIPSAAGAIQPGPGLLFHDGESGGSANREQTSDCGVKDDDKSSHQGNSSTVVAGQTSQTSVMDNPKAKEEKIDPNSSPNGGPENIEGPSGSSRVNNIQDGNSRVPLGLGQGGLQPKRRGTQAGSEASRAAGQHVLQSLVSSLSTRGDTNPPSSGQPSDHGRGISVNSRTSTQRNSNDNTDVSEAVSQVLASPSLNGLLSGVSRQTGAGSPDLLRNMLQQFTQNPAVMSTVNQMAQQMDGQDFSGLGGGFDISRMMQQMMPIVSQALGGISSGSRANPPSERAVVGNIARSDDVAPIDDDPQVYFDVTDRLEEQRPSEEVFRSMVNGVVRLSGGGADVVNELCSHTGLAQEFMDMLLLDLSKRVEGEM